VTIYTIQTMPEQEARMVAEAFEESDLEMILD
jgi:hypothetical protein